ncbi:TldD/PmbA family protein, partial [Gemmatimonadota bacterium]
MEYSRLSEQLVGRCLRKGADAAEIWLETNRSLSLEVRNGEVETIQESSSAGAGFRVFVAGRMAFAHSNDLSNASMDQAMESAIEFAGHLTPDEFNILPADRDITEVEGLFDPGIASITTDEKVALLKRAEALAMSNEGITRSNGASFFDGEGEVYLANSNGLVKNYRASGVGYGVSVVAEKGEQRSSGGYSSTKRFYSDLFDPEEVAETAAIRAREMLDPRMVPTQRAPVIFDPRVSGTLLGGILGAINGERVLQGASFLAGRIGEKIATDLLTVIDDGTLPKGMS